MMDDYASYYYQILLNYKWFKCVIYSSLKL